MNNRVGHYKVGHLVEQMERYCQFRRQKKKSELRFSGVCGMFEFSGLFQPEHPTLMHESKYNYSGVFDRISLRQ